MNIDTPSNINDPDRDQIPNCVLWSSTWDDTRTPDEYAALLLHFRHYREIVHGDPPGTDLYSAHVSFSGRTIRTIMYSGVKDKLTFIHEQRGPSLEPLNSTIVHVRENEITSTYSRVDTSSRVTEYVTRWARYVNSDDPTCMQWLEIFRLQPQTTYHGHRDAIPICGNLLKQELQHRLNKGHSQRRKNPTAIRSWILESLREWTPVAQFNADQLNHLSQQWLNLVVALGAADSHSTAELCALLAHLDPLTQQGSGDRAVQTLSTILSSGPA